MPLTSMRCEKNEGLEIHFVKDGFFINKDATGNQMFMWEAKVFSCQAIPEPPVG